MVTNNINNNSGNSNENDSNDDNDNNNKSNNNNDNKNNDFKKENDGIYIQRQFQWRSQQQCNLTNYGDKIMFTPMSNKMSVLRSTSSPGRNYGWMFLFLVENV